MNDLISRQAALEMLNDDELERQVDDVFDGSLHRYKRAAQRIIAQLPTIDPVKHGKWIKNEGRYGWHCSVCGEDDLYAFAWNSDKGEKELQDRYCPECGAQMDGGENETD